MVERIEPGGNRITVITAGHEKFSFDAVVLCSGSVAYPQLGGSRSGYELASSVGHKIIEPFPSIVPITIPLKILHRLEGIKWDCKVSVDLNGKNISESEGELLFTKYGLSGPVSLDVSRHVNENIIKNIKPDIIIDLFPDLGEDELLDRLETMWADKSKSASFSLIGIMKERMNEILLKIAGIDPEKPVGSISEKEKGNIIKTLKSLKLMPGDPRSFNEAVVTAGGVNVDEINPSTMESRLMKNLFITGELLDIDGDSGGYNLQFAWSTGAIAGMSQCDREN